MSSSHNVRNEFAAGREIDRLPECPPLSAELTRTITQTVFVSSAPEDADIMFVFGTSRTEGWPAVARLFAKGYAPRVLITGGKNDGGMLISHTIRDSLMLWGIPKRDMITEEKSTNTLEDALFGKALLEKLLIPHRSILFVSNGPHSGRCLRTLKKVFPLSKISAFIYDFVEDGKVITDDNWWQTEYGRKRVWGEYSRIQLYSSRGDIC